MPERRDETHVAYFSMEMALDSAMPTYSGGLGVLAGDTMRAAADAGLRMVGVTVLYNEGYFTQMLDVQGKQLERPVTWDPDEFLERNPVTKWRPRVMRLKLVSLERLGRCDEVEALAGEWSGSFAAADPRHDVPGCR